MNVKTYLESELRKHVDAAKSKVADAQTEGRQLTDSERAEVETHSKAAADVKAKLADIVSNDDLLKTIEGLGQSVIVPGGGTPSAAPAKSIGAAFVQSKEYKALMERGIEGGSWSTGPVSLNWFGQKANETVHAADDTPQDFRPGIVDIAKQANTVMGIVPSATTDSNIIRYLKETTATNAADDTAEIAAYDQSVLKFDNADVEVEKVATILYVSDEMLSDVAGMRSYLDGRLAAFVDFQEEEQVVNGNGASPQLDGLFAQTTQAQALAGDTVADAIYKAKTQVRTGSFLEPTHVLVHPTDWQTIRLAKDGNDNYMNGLGPFTGGDSEPPVWGLRPIVTSRVAAGTALVGAFSPIALQLFRKGGVTVEATNSHGELFASGQVAIRASSRMGLVIYRPAAFCEVTGL